VAVRHLFYLKRRPLDHDRRIAQYVDVPQRVASYGDHVGELAFGNRP
jgi:hypothetical protein